MQGTAIPPDIQKRAQQLITAWGKSAPDVAARRSEEAARFGDRLGAQRWAATKSAVEIMMERQRRMRP